MVLSQSHVYKLQRQLTVRGDRLQSTGAVPTRRVAERKVRGDEIGAVVIGK